MLGGDVGGADASYRRRSRCRRHRRARATCCATARTSGSARSGLAPPGGGHDCSRRVQPPDAAAPPPPTTARPRARRVGRHGDRGRAAGARSSLDGRGVGTADTARGSSRARDRAARAAPGRGPALELERDRAPRAGAQPRRSVRAHPADRAAGHRERASRRSTSCASSSQVPIEDIVEHVDIEAIVARVDLVGVIRESTASLTAGGGRRAARSRAWRSTRSAPRSSTGCCSASEPRQLEVAAVPRRETASVRARVALQGPRAGFVSRADRGARSTSLIVFVAFLVALAALSRSSRYLVDRRAARPARPGRGVERRRHGRRC